MAKERVQVQGLGDVAPGITPTIQRAGQYSVAQVRAAPVQAPRSKLLDLAEALGTGQQLLQQYGQAAEQEAQLFEEELARKSPEEVQAMLKKSEGELDKLVRQKAIGWLTSPLNQKRKMQAVGALLHDDYARQLKAQVEDPANADADINELIAGVKDNLRNQYGSLQSTFVNEGFEGAIRETTRKYTLAHDSIATEQARKQLYRAGKNVLFNSAILIKDEVTGNTRMSDADLLNQWYEENQGAFTPAELLNLRKEVSLELAQRDPDSARNFLNYTGGFKVGTSKMSEAMGVKGEDVFSMYGAEEADIYEDIDKIELADQTKNVHAAKVERATIEAEAFEIANTLRNGQSYVGEGDLQITTRIEAENYLFNKLQQSDNVLVKGFSGAQTIKKGLALLEMPDDENFIQLKENYARAYSGENSFRFRQDTIKKSFLSQYLIEDFSTGRTTLNPRYELLFNEVVSELARERGYKLQEISKGSFTDVNNNQITSSKQAIQFETMRGWDDFYLKELSNRLEQRASQVQGKIEVSKQIESDTTPAEKISERVSFVEPSKTISEATTYWFEGNNNFADLEEAARKGESKKVEEIVKRLESESRPVLVGVGGPSLYPGKKYIARRVNLLDSTLNIITSTKSTKEEVESAKRKIALYATVKGLFNATNIKAGSIRVGTRDIAIDREALKSLSLIYPLISKERLIELAKPGDKDTPQEQELFEALYNVTLDENDPNDKKLLEKFITEQAALANRIYKN